MAWGWECTVLPRTKFQVRCPDTVVPRAMQWIAQVAVRPGVGSLGGIRISREPSVKLRISLDMGEVGIGVDKCPI